MTEPRTVWAVSTGEYSDYRVHGVFEDKADADRAAVRLDGNWNAARVTAMNLYAPGDATLRIRTFYDAWVDVSPAGVIGKARAHRRQSVPHDGRHATTVDYYGEPGEGHGYLVETSADTKERAVKSVGEKAAQVAVLAAEGHDPVLMERGHA